MATNADSSKVSKTKFYDLTRIKEIPILEVCNVLGIETKDKGRGDYLCSIRPDDKSPSTYIHTTGSRKNTFYDFGGEHGDIIKMVSLVKGITIGEAIQFLGETFHISPNNAERSDPNDLADYEYAKIGLYADLATKNFDFDPNLTQDKLMSISMKYRMPLRQLRKKHPKIYEKLLWQRAIPFVQELRNMYYLSVWNDYKFAEALGIPDLFYTGSGKAHLDETIVLLNKSEILLKRAIAGTTITPRDPQKYDPIEDYRKLASGELKPSLPNVSSFKEMQKASRVSKSALKTRDFSYEDYLDALHNISPQELNQLDLRFSAFFKAGRVVVRFLEKDIDKINRIFQQDKSKINTTVNLSLKIADAKAKQAQHASLQDPIQKDSENIQM